MIWTKSKSWQDLTTFSLKQQFCYLLDNRFQLSVSLSTWSCAYSICCIAFPNLYSHVLHSDSFSRSWGQVHNTTNTFVVQDILVQILILSLSTSVWKVHITSANVLHENYWAGALSLCLNLLFCKLSSHTFHYSIDYINLLNFCKTHHVKAFFLSWALYHICVLFQMFHTAEKTLKIIFGEWSIVLCRGCVFFFCQKLF